MLTADIMKNSTSKHASCHFCKGSLSLKTYNFFGMFAVPMSTLAILKIKGLMANLNMTSNVTLKFLNFHIISVFMVMTAILEFITFIAHMQMVVKIMV